MALNVTATVFDSVDSQTSGAKANNLAQAGTLKKQWRITIGMSEVDVNESTDITTPGYLALVNQGTQDTLSWGVATGVYPFSLKPGEPTTVRINSTGSARIFVISNNTNDSDNFEFTFYSD